MRDQQLNTGLSYFYKKNVIEYLRFNTLSQKHKNDNIKNLLCRNLTVYYIRAKI